MSILTLEIEQYVERMQVSLRTFADTHGWLQTQDTLKTPLVTAFRSKYSLIERRQGQPDKSSHQQPATEFLSSREVNDWQRIHERFLKGLVPPIPASLNAQLDTISLLIKELTQQVERLKNYFQVKKQSEIDQRVVLAWQRQCLYLVEALLAQMHALARSNFSPPANVLLYETVQQQRIRQHNHAIKQLVNPGLFSWSLVQSEEYDFIRDCLHKLPRNYQFLFNHQAADALKATPILSKDRQTIQFRSNVTEPAQFVLADDHADFSVAFKKEVNATDVVVMFSFSFNLQPANCFHAVLQQQLQQCANEQEQHDMIGLLIAQLNHLPRKEAVKVYRALAVFLVKILKKPTSDRQNAQAVFAQLLLVSQTFIANHGSRFSHQHSLNTILKLIHKHVVAINLEFLTLTSPLANTIKKLIPLKQQQMRYLAIHFPAQKHLPRISLPVIPVTVPLKQSEPLSALLDAHFGDVASFMVFLEAKSASQSSSEELTVLWQQCGDDALLKDRFLLRVAALFQQVLTKDQTFAAASLILQVDVLAFILQSSLEFKDNNSKTLLKKTLGFILADAALQEFFFGVKANFPKEVKDFFSLAPKTVEQRLSEEAGMDDYFAFCHTQLLERHHSSLVIDSAIEQGVEATIVSDSVSIPTIQRVIDQSNSDDVEVPLLPSRGVTPLLTPSNAFLAAMPSLDLSHNVVTDVLRDKKRGNGIDRLARPITLRV